MRRLLVFLVLCAGCAPSTDSAETAASAPVETRLVRDPASSAELPRVVLPERPEVERRVNADLDSLSASLRCEDVGTNTADTSFDVRSAVAFAGADVLSVSVHAAYYCGGAYPTNDANLSATYDLATGRRVPFEALWRDYAADQAAITGVLGATLAPAAQAGEFISECADLFAPEAIATTTFAYVLSDAGLVVQPEYPHVMEACAVEATVPYGSVRAFAAEDGVLARVAGASAPR